MPKIFLSYRREDTEYPAQSIYDKLVDRFGRESVVFDVDTIPLGIDFRDYLNQEVSKCDILLAVIGNRWLDILKQRLNEPNDFVRIEIQAALERDIPVVPVLVKNASVPSATDLPPELLELTYKQAAEVRAGADYQNQLNRLIDGLDNLITGRPYDEDPGRVEGKSEEPSPPESAKSRIGRKIPASVFVVVALLVCLVAVVWFYLPPSGPPDTNTNSIGMTFALIPAGSFTMGSPESEAGRYSGETQHSVTITQPFYIQTTEVTQGQWQKVMGLNPSYFKNCGDDCPVEQVSWKAAQNFIAKLNAKEDVTYYRLPTEAEWEYAARAGSTTLFSFGNYERELGEHAWYSDNSNYRTHQVGTKKANTWGLYDMHGNVWEWVADWSGDYPSGSVIDPEGPQSGSGTRRVIRGGSWRSDARSCRSANRGVTYGPGNRDHNVGFRLARSVTLAP